VGADGRGQRALAVAGEFTDWSPDSTRLVWTDSVLTSDSRRAPPRLWVGDVASGEARVLDLLGNDTRWLPDGERISYVPYEPPREIRTLVVDVDGGQSRELVAGAGIRWAPDGGAFAFEREDGIYLADADGGNIRLLLEGRASPAWSPDGSRLAFVDVDDSGNFVVGVATREGEILWEGSPGIDPAWSPDGGHLAVDLTIGEPLIGILDATSGERIWMLEGRFPDW
jgi:Tol biopolymer transport system component